MADLIAQGAHSEHRWRRELEKPQSVSIGRGEGWQVPWDNAISQRHAELSWDGLGLVVKRLPDARNPIFFKGAEVDLFKVRPREHFVIGTTTFTLADELVEVTLDAPAPLTQQHYSARELQRTSFRDADLRLGVLTQLSDIIDHATDDSELLQSLVNILLAGAFEAEAVGMVECRDVTDTDQQQKNLSVLKWDRRRVTGQSFNPSRRLVEQAMVTGETVLHCWNVAMNAEQPFTMNEDTTWAVACPVPGRPADGWCLYLTGNQVGSLTAGDPSLLDRLRDDIKFCELVSSFLSKLIKLRTLQRDRATLAQFFSPLVLQAVAANDPEEVLAPRQTEVSVLFCDLKGFSKQSEQQSDDLMGLLHRVSQVLGVTTEAILEFGGVVGDFHGDAAMGFWGWPVSAGDEVQQACRAALAIRASLDRSRREANHPLAEFHMGLGMATGTAVAGKIGTKDQVKVTVFGPVVNLASRLESMTRQLRAAILIDAATARIVREQLPSDKVRCRRLAVVRPYGMSEVVEVHELLPPAREDELLTDAHIESFERAWDSMVEGDWTTAFELLHQVPADDRAKDFLTVYIAQHDRQPPADWQGFIPLLKK